MRRLAVALTVLAATLMGPAALADNLGNRHTSAVKSVAWLGTGGESESIRTTPSPSGNTSSSAMDAGSGRAASVRRGTAGFINSTPTVLPSSSVEVAHRGQGSMSVTVATTEGVCAQITCLKARPPTTWSTASRRAALPHLRLGAGPGSARATRPTAIEATRWMARMSPSTNGADESASSAGEFGSESNEPCKGEGSCQNRSRKGCAEASAPCSDDDKVTVIVCAQPDSCRFEGTPS